MQSEAQSCFIFQALGCHFDFSILFAVELVAPTPGGTRFDPESGRCGSAQPELGHDGHDMIYNDL